jgi:CubicO group peptidase (beta-lactamase class C family)
MKAAIGWLIALCLVGVSEPVLGQNAPGAAPPSTPEQQMDRLFDFWDRLDQPGFAVVVVKDGRVLYQKVFGLACQEHAVAITPDSVFNVGPLAQPFVGQAVALLERQGRLSLDDDVRKFIPELPDFGTTVRVRHLLFHTSGLRDWLPVVQLTGVDAEEITIDRVLKIAGTQRKPLFVPGAREQFSNTDYDLLAEAIKRATGKAFSDWAFENVFRPLKMTRTLYRDNYRSIFDNEALSYNYTREQYLRGRDTLSLAGSHSLFTSIGDLSKWFVDVETARGDAANIYDRMFTAGTLDAGASSGFGYGVRVESESGRRRVIAAGTWAGSGGTLAYYPDQKFGFAVLANWDYTSAEGFGPDIIRIYLPAPAPPRRPAPVGTGAPVTVSPEMLDRHAGTYRLGPGDYVTFSRTDGQLFVEVSPGQKVALVALSPTEFFLALADVRIAFQTGKDGNVDRLVLTQGGEDRVAPKVVLVKPTPPELQEFAGSYANDELNMHVRLDVAANGLVMGPTPRDLRLFPETKDRFTSRLPLVPAIVFQRDAQGRISGFTIDSDTVRDLLFKRE